MKNHYYRHLVKRDKRGVYQFNPFKVVFPFFHILANKQEKCEILDLMLMAGWFQRKLRQVSHDIVSMFTTGHHFSLFLEFSSGLGLIDKALFCQSAISGVPFSFWSENFLNHWTQYIIELATQYTHSFHAGKECTSINYYENAQRILS